MKNKKINITIFASLLLFVATITSTISFAQTKDMSNMKDCCMMKDGKMMQMKGGKMMPMKKGIKMKNGTKCMINGECVMKDGTKMKMQNGDCMDMDGQMDKCELMQKHDKASHDMKDHKKEMSMTYTCPMHPEVVKNQPGKCPKCGMDLVEKK